MLYMWNDLGTISEHALVMASAVADLVYPPHCLMCGADIEPDSDIGLCEQCRDSIPLIGDPSCVRCGASVGPHAATDRCPACATKHLPFARSAAAGPYRGPLRELILHLKYGRRALLSKPAAALMLRSAERCKITEGIDFIVPVPLHERKLRERGFNQAELLARRVAAALDIPLRDDVLLRAKNTAAQTGLDKSSRGRNVEGAFAVRPGSYVRGARLLLIDDVMTTGSTLSECASVLKAAGASEIRVLVAARD